jgi:hypothetical protein
MKIPAQGLFTSHASSDPFIAPGKREHVIKTKRIWSRFSPQSPPGGRAGSGKIKKGYSVILTTNFFKIFDGKKE